jgi:hypothetical protein
VEYREAAANAYEGRRDDNHDAREAERVRDRRPGIDLRRDRVLGHARRYLPDGRRADVLLRQGEALRRGRQRAAGIKEQLKGTFIDTVPGTDAARVILGILEFGVFVLLLASLVRLEILPHRDKSLLQVGLAVAMLTFACLAFGQTVTRQFEGTASLYTYFASTVVILILVSLMPPNRPDRWLGGGGMR